MRRKNWRYLIGLGSNQRHVRFGAPRQVLSEAIMRLEGNGLGLGIAERQVTSAPLGPSRRRYANTVALITSQLDPPEVLARLQAIERDFGRRRSGQRWSARVLDLDVVLWSGGGWRSTGLTIPHPRFRERRFVLDPAARLMPDWRDPITRLTLRQLAARLTRPRPLPIAPDGRALSSVGRATDF